MPGVQYVGYDALFHRHGYGVRNLIQYQIPSTMQGTWFKN